MTPALHTWFQQDHARLDELLTRAVADPSKVDLEAYDAFRAGLLRHIGLEEKVLLPALQRLTGEKHPHSRRLRVDHGAIVLLLVPTPTHALVAELRSILGPHNQLEEGADGIYAAAARIPRAESEALWEQVQAYPQVPVRPYFDGPGVYRTANEALAISGKQK